MKALVISDKQEIIDSLCNYLKQNNYDIIVYRWLLKALDNIEEIHPDIIFVNASEYPRHWKTLASFVQSGIGGNEVKLYLYAPDALSDDEKNKADQLGIEAYIDSLSDEQLSKILPCISGGTEFVKETSYELMLTHPVSKKFVFGKAVLRDGSDEYDCQLDPFCGLEMNQTVDLVSVFDKEYTKAFSALVVEIKADKYKLKVKNYYEEEK